MTQTIPAISEADFQRNVIDLAKLFGWRVAHFRPAQTKHGWRTPMQGSPGFPDLVLAKEGRVIFAELKSENGKLSAHQIEWLQALSGDEEEGNDEYEADEIDWNTYDLEGDVGVHVWRPSDLDAIGKLLGPG